MERTIAGVHHVALRAADFEATLRFYCDGLGLRLKARWEEDGVPVAMLEAGGGTYLEVFGSNLSPATQGGPVLHIALCTPNPDTALQQALNADTRLIDKPRDYNIEAHPESFRARLAYCAGPNGEVIEFIESADL